jgi:AcrR family transcriptional regulator
MSETTDRILDTAERLFAERGYGATSLRSIIAAAGVNLAAVHYYFRSKEALLDAVLTRRLEPVNRERLALLEECERAAGGGVPALEGVLAALIGPPMRLALDPGRAVFMKLMGRIHAEADVVLIRKHFGEVIERFMKALARALPELPPEELQCRAFFCIGIMAHTMLAARGIVGSIGDVTTERLVAFMSAGFRAPMPAAARSNV